MTISGVMDLEVAIMWRTKLAVKVHTPELGNGDGIWLSLSQVDIEDDDGESLGPATITLPKWLAQKEGLA